MSDELKIYMGHLWVQQEGNTVTVGLTEETIGDFDEVVSFDLPEEQQNVEADEICGTIETNDGPIDIYSPVTGTVLEINTTLFEDPSALMEDPQGDGWLLKIASEDAIEDEDDEDEDDDDDDFYDEDEEEDEE